MFLAEGRRLPPHYCPKGRRSCGAERPEAGQGINPIFFFKKKKKKKKKKKVTLGPQQSPLTPALRPPNPESMEVHLTPDQKAFVRQAIESGRLGREEDAVQEALFLWEERERTRAEIVAAVDVAEASIARGEGRTITQESMRQLADEVKQRGRSRLAAE